MNKPILFGLSAVVLMLAVGTVALENSAFAASTTGLHKATPNTAIQVNVGPTKIYPIGSGWTANMNPQCKMTKTGIHC